MYDELDLEDIECRLYSQVYHSATENEELGLPLRLDIISSTNDKVPNNRYFSKQHIPDKLGTFIPLQEENNSNNVGSLINTEENYSNQVQNNTIVNEYTSPSISNCEQNEVLNSSGDAEKSFVPWCVKNKKLLDKKNRRQQKRLEKRRQKNQEKQSQNNSKVVIGKNRGIGKRVNTHTVYISDDSDSECEIVTDMTKKSHNLKEPKPKFTKTLANRKPSCEDDDDDDDIIFIPPPPIEVINIDVDEDSLVNIDKRVISPTTEAINSHAIAQSPESSTSNDFLDNSGVENNGSNFNFSLHGSDFNNPGDFVRPADPVEYCETESSCSTNDFNRENNSVKTIVFNEVDFPKEDIFSDKNLEGFSTFITPKRTTSRESASNCLPKAADAVNERLMQDESSLSSSESDYESIDIVNKSTKTRDAEHNKKLPTLSHMQCDKIELSKNQNSKCSNEKLQSTSPKPSRKISRKRNSTSLNITESDTDEESISVAKQKPKKKKKVANKKTSSSEESEKAKCINEFENKNPETEIEETTANNVNNKDDITKSLEKETEKVSENTVHTESRQERSNGSLDLEEPNILSTSCKKKKKNSGKKNGESSEKLKRKKSKVNSIENESPSEFNCSLSGVEDIDPDNKFSNINEASNSVICGDIRKKEKPTSTVLQVEYDNDNSNKSDSKCSNNHEKDKLSKDKRTENEDIIVVDDTVSDDPEDFVEIVLSSDEELCLKDLEDAEHSIELANCSITSNTVDDIIDVDDSITLTDNKNSSNRSAINNNICKDYSNFDVEQIQRTQSDDPRIWKIILEDRLLFLNSGGNKGPRCNRCRRFGHIAVRCTEKPYPPSCTLCGHRGHQEPRCPNKICTQCGNAGHYSTTYCWKCIKFRNSVCHICKMTGHLAKFCPDLWRRYHLTTQEGPLVTLPGPQLKPRDKLWCSGCASQGHLEHECDYYNREYPPTDPSVISYENVFHEEGSDKLRDAPKPPTPPPPVWNSPNINMYMNQPTSSIPCLPSSSTNIPYGTSFYMPPIMSLNVNPIFLHPTGLRQSELVPNTSISCSPTSTRVVNPFSVLIKEDNDSSLKQMLVDYIKDCDKVRFKGCFTENGKVFIYAQKVKQGVLMFLKSKDRRIRQIIMSMPSHAVNQFLNKEMADLENIVSHIDPKLLKSMLFKYDNISHTKKVLSCEVVKEKCFWYRLLNMYIFGVHQYEDGKGNFNYIKRYLSEPKDNKLDPYKRKSLYNAYNYIFNAVRHSNINYYNFINQLIHRDHRIDSSVSNQNFGQI